MEFHISRQARDHYGFDENLFSFNGNVIFANFHAARIFAQKINSRTDPIQHPDRIVHSGQINAMGMIDEILHFVVSMFRKEENPDAMNQAYAWLVERIGRDSVDKTIREFCSDFPPVDVYRQKISLDEYLAGSSRGTPNTIAALEEMLLLWIANRNPALKSFQELFDDRRLERETAYREVMYELNRFFDIQPHFGPDGDSLVDMLRRPAVVVPESLFGQLEYIREHWASILGWYLSRLLSSLDLIREEEKIAFPGPGPIPIPTYDHLKTDEAGEAGAAERYTPDRDWMPNLVLIAKNIHVWLDQLSKKYGRLISTLDRIPDEELDLLAHRGITGLWLIGLWERSAASARIKQMCGNPEAIASAYSLAGYRIATDLGGNSALENLRSRAWSKGIRLASDMVPNHTGIDSQWVIEHPDWFISLDYCPYPSYSFNGPNLSGDSRVSIYLEDHYYTRSDAAVVFKWVNNRTGETRFIYHGNDGTSMPWNDTAQLNYLKKEVREAVIQTILQVAQRFPIIRFDAAMTLTRQHFQRLWFPEPGSGGDIPTRSENGLPTHRFNQQMEDEFWREVVDRAAVEAHDTLLLAEAFWLMESFFVRTLGMHRVYNSAFMNLLRDEDNGKYRTILKNTLEFDPEIMKRFVNFMNNPDERTAIDQFGKGDKYFGICTLLATLPGLPMLGHGQIEGFSEKYGMEYRKAYWNEQPDPILIERHEREIFPLLHRRALFAGVEQFLLYDFTGESGEVNEDVFAYSNGHGNEHALVIYNNRYAGARGRIHISSPLISHTPDGKRPVRKTLAEGLALEPSVDKFIMFRDQAGSLQYLYPSTSIAEHGLSFELGAYESRVLIDFKEKTDDEQHSYRKLCEYLGGRGVPDIEEARRKLLLQPVLSPFKQISNPDYFRFLLNSRLIEERTTLPPDLLPEAEVKLQNLLDGVRWYTGLHIDQKPLQQYTSTLLGLILSLPLLTRQKLRPLGTSFEQSASFIMARLEQNPALWYALFGWTFICWPDNLSTFEKNALQSSGGLDIQRFIQELSRNFEELGVSDSENRRLVAGIHLLGKYLNWLEESKTADPAAILQNWLEDEEVSRFLHIHNYQDITWFNREGFEEFIWWMSICPIINSVGKGFVNTGLLVENMVIAWQILEQLLNVEQESKYQVPELIRLLQKGRSGVNPEDRSSPGHVSSDD